MSLKKRLQALAKIAKGGPHAVEIRRNGRAVACNNRVRLSTPLLSGVSEEVSVDPTVIAEVAKGMSAKDTDFCFSSGTSDFPPIEPLPYLPPADPSCTTHVDPFLLKRAVDALTSCWEGPKADACVRVHFYPSQQAIVMSANDVHVILRSVVPV